MNYELDDRDRRSMLARFAVGGTAMVASGARASGLPSAALNRRDWYDLKEDFHAAGDGAADDTDALQIAINSGSAHQRPVSMPPGVYRITRALSVPSNTMLIGSAPGLGFGCRIEPTGCPAFVIGGAIETFHCAIENLMIWPKGPAPEYILSIDNSYSVTFRNIRIHDAQERLGRAAVLLLGHPKAGGHGRCNNIIWDNLVVRNDTGQPAVAVLAGKGCGTHRFLAPCFENYAVLLDWQGGQLDLIAPYTERAGRYAVNCNLDTESRTAYLNTFGGSMDCANSGIGCAIRATTRNLNSFGTQWGATADRAAYAYAVPEGPVTFHGIAPNLGSTDNARYAGVAGWRRAVGFPQAVFKTSKPLDIELAAGARLQSDIDLPGVDASDYWARVTVNGDTMGAQISAFVSKRDAVTVVVQNATGARINLDRVFTVECGLV